MRFRSRQIPKTRGLASLLGAGLIMLSAAVTLAQDKQEPAPAAAAKAEAKPEVKPEATPEPNTQTGGLTSKDLNILSWRAVGPWTFSGRITNFAVPPGQSLTYYVLTATGGLWKTVIGLGAADFFALYSSRRVRRAGRHSGTRPKPVSRARRGLPVGLLYTAPTTPPRLEPKSHQQVTWNSPITGPLARFHWAMASGVGASETSTCLAARKSAASLDSLTMPFCPVPTIRRSAPFS